MEKRELSDEEMQAYESWDEDSLDEEIIDEENQMQEEEEEEKEPELQVYLPGQPLQEGEVLDYDSSAYDMFHSLSVEWPSLSFDIIRDNLGDKRMAYPMKCSFVTGTQSDMSANNSISVIETSNLCQTKNDEDSDADSDDEDESVPVVAMRSLKINSGVNRIRSLPQDSQRLCAAWCDDATVRLYDYSEAFKSLEDKSRSNISTAPKEFQRIKNHKCEGFAMAWSLVTAGRLVTGDCSGRIHLTTINESVVSESFIGHNQSVEDLSWSPTESNVFASCSVDGTVRLWDSRKFQGSVLDGVVSSVDVNVISWNSKVSHLFAAGMDDGSFAVYDLRQFSKTPTPMARFDWHKKPITSIEWNNSDESVLAVCGADDQLTIWDLSLEKDNDMKEEDELVPPQLLCIHQGQDEMKELHWHPQLHNVMMSTSLSGFHIFKSIAMEHE